MLATLADLGIDAVVAIGGDDTLGVAKRLGPLGVSVVGVPKTIDNDLSGTEVTFGFDTAVQTATEAIDRLRHHGRVAPPGDRLRGDGPPRRLDRHLRRHRRRGGRDPRPRGPLRPRRGLRAAGAPPPSAASSPRSSWCPRARCRPRAPTPSRPAEATLAEVGGRLRPRPAGGIGQWLAEEIERRTGYESRVTTLGHIQRGGTPTAFDRVLATRFGVAAVAAVHDGDFGTMVALQAGRIVRVPLEEAVGNPKTLDRVLLERWRRPSSAERSAPGAQRRRGRPPGAARPPARGPRC